MFRKDEKDNFVVNSVGKYHQWRMRFTDGLFVPTYHNTDYVQKVEGLFWGKNNYLYKQNMDPCAPCPS